MHTKFLEYSVSKKFLFNSNEKSFIVVYLSIYNADFQYYIINFNLFRII